MYSISSYIEELKVNRNKSYINVIPEAQVISKVALQNVMIDLISHIPV